MDYASLAAAYDQVETTSKRLEMAAQLAELFRGTPVDLLPRVVYLTQGRLLPDFRGLELGLADKLVMKAIAFAAGMPEKEIETNAKAAGDLGLVAEEALGRRRQTSLVSETLTIDRVYDGLSQIARSTGPGAQERKMKILAELLQAGTPKEARFLVRTVLGRLRLGTGDMTILDGLAGAFATKQDRPLIEQAYNLCADLGAVADSLARKGMPGISTFTVQVRSPVRPMLAERLTSIEETLAKLGGDAILEYKYDGLRIQAHIGATEITLFSRQLENITGQFPDVVTELRKAFKGKAAIVEGECVAIDVETGDIRPFQEVAHRRGRKIGMASAVDDFPVSLVLFDILLIDGRPLIGTPLEERRKALKKAFRTSDRIQLTESVRTKDVEKARSFFLESIAAGCEGVMGKQPSSVYAAGARGFQWIKFKREYRSEMTDTADLVIVGAFAGRGKRSGRYGALLMAARNADEGTYETVCKLGTGFNDEFLAALPDRLKDAKLGRQDPKVIATLKPDAHFAPVHVLEVIGAEITVSPVHTCGKGRVSGGGGLAIRFPRYAGKWRVDKRAEDATTTAEILSMYEHQARQRQAGTGEGGAAAAAAVGPVADDDGGEDTG